MNLQSIILFLLIVWSAGVSYWWLATGAFRQLRWTTEVMTLVVSFLVAVGVVYVFIR